MKKKRSQPSVIHPNQSQPHETHLPSRLPPPSFRDQLNAHAYSSSSRPATGHPRRRTGQARPHGTRFPSGRSSSASCGSCSCVSAAAYAPQLRQPPRRRRHHHRHYAPSSAASSAAVAPAVEPPASTAVSFPPSRPSPAGAGQAGRAWAWA